MTPEQYYKTPPQKVFDEIKKAALDIWMGYVPKNSRDSYREEKIMRIKDIENASDNAWYMVAMFDPNNQRRLLQNVSFETAQMIQDAMSPT